VVTSVDRRAAIGRSIGAFEGRVESGGTTARCSRMNTRAVVAMVVVAGAVLADLLTRPVPMYVPPFAVRVDVEPRAARAVDAAGTNILVTIFFEGTKHQFPESFGTNVETTLPASGGTARVEGLVIPDARRGERLVNATVNVRAFAAAVDCGVIASVPDRVHHTMEEAADRVDLDLRGKTLVVCCWLREDHPAGPPPCS
jgi:hypothetical protein